MMTGKNVVPHCDQDKHDVPHTQLHSRITLCFQEAKDTAQVKPDETTSLVLVCCRSAATTPSLRVMFPAAANIFVVVCSSPNLTLILSLQNSRTKEVIAMQGVQNQRGCCWLLVKFLSNVDHWMVIQWSFAGHTE